VLGVGQRRYEEVLAQPVLNPPVEPGDLPAIMQRIGSDFEQGYIITGMCVSSIPCRTWELSELLCVLVVIGQLPLVIGMDFMTPVTSHVNCH
jgi:hypothetical protein